MSRIYRHLLLVTVLVSAVAIDLRDPQGYRIRSPSKYLVLTPRSVRPAQEYRVYVNILNQDSQASASSVIVQAVVSCNGSAIARAQKNIRQGEIKLLTLQIPDNLMPGKYTVRVEGAEGTFGESYFFRNETEIAFNPKAVSVFVQADNPLVKKTGLMNFRVIALTPTLKPVVTGTFNVYVKDWLGMVLRRWYGQHIHNGMWQGSYQHAHPARHGWWTIEVEGWGHNYVHRVKTEKSFPDLFQVNLTAPFYLFENEAAHYALAKSNFTSGVPTRGNASFEVTIMPPGKTDNFSVIHKSVRYYDKGAAPCVIPLAEIAKHTPQLAGTKLLTKATMYDAFHMESKSAEQETEIMSSNIGIYILGGNSRVFKPGVEFDIYVAVYQLDGSPFSRYENRQLHLQVSLTTSDQGLLTIPEKVLIIPDSGIVHHSWMPTRNISQFIVTVRYYSMAVEEVVATRHYTESGNYVAITTSTRHPKINKAMIFNVHKNVHTEDTKFLVLTKGGIYLHGDISMGKNSLHGKASFTLRTELMPFAHLLVYTITPGGEVLTDSLHFYVDGLAESELDISINKGKDFTMDTVEIRVKSEEAGILVAFSAMLWDLYSRGGNREEEANMFFTKHALERELLTYEMGVNTSFSFTWLKPYERRETVHFNAPCSAVDANQTFVFAGLDVFTDAQVARIPTAWTACNVTLGFLPCNDGISCYLNSEGCDGTWNCPDKADEMGCSETVDYRRPDAFDHYPRWWAHFDSGDWAFKSTYIKHDGRLDLEVNLPSGPTTWVVGGFSLSPKTGLAFVEVPVRVDTTRHFNMDVQVPPRARKGEQIGVQIAVFNYWQYTLEVLVTLQDSDQYRFVTVEDFGVVSSYAPRTRHGDIQTMVYLAGGEGRYLFMPILPTVLGKVTVRVNAQCTIGRAEAIVSFTVTMDGVESMAHTPFFMDLINSGSMMNPSLEITTEEQFRHPENNFNWYVPGSPKAIITLAGDVVGPSLDKGFVKFNDIFYYNIDGHGDTVLFEIAYNLYMMRFLKAINQLPGDTMNEVLHAALPAIVQVSAFMKDDGSMSMRQSTPGSLWLSAFALEVLTKATDPEWEHILYIDPATLNKMANWVASQQKQSGSFPLLGEIYDRKLLSNVSDEQGVPLNISLTAYVAIGLAKATPVLTGADKTLAYQAYTKAAEYLSNNLHRIRDPFEICLVTYALYVTNHRSKDDAFGRMREYAIRDEFVYWSPERIPHPQHEIVSNMPYLQPKHMPLPFESRAVQATSYALLVYLIKNPDSEDSLPIMKFLQTQRNTDRSFAATQDSFVALKALCEYGEHVSNREIFGMQVHLDATSTVDSQDLWDRVIDLPRGNFTKYIELQAPVAFGSIQSRTSGTGLAMLQMTVTENVEHDFLIRQPDVHSFDLTADVQYNGRNGSRIDYNICFRWTLIDVQPQSGSTILQIDLPSGYEALKHHINAAAKLVRLPTFRPRFSRGAVVLYLDYVDAEWTCFQFHAVRFFPVANVTAQHRVRIFDTFEPGYQNTTMYKTWTLFHLNICQVCGSFQCPYCPYYNIATSRFMAITKRSGIMTLPMVLSIISWWIVMA